MHLPLWLGYALIALFFWGITGVTQKLSTNSISAELSFLWFAFAMIAIALVILPFVAPDWHVKPGVFWMAALGGALNGLGVVTSFAALERGGKASIVIPLIYLYPLVTIFLSLAFLRETLTRVQAIGVGLAILAAFLLSREAPPQDRQKE